MPKILDRFLVFRFHSIFFSSAFQFFLHRLRFDFIDLLTLAHMFPDFLFRSGIWFSLWRSVIVAVLLHFGSTNTYILSLNLLCAIFDVIYIRKCVCVCFGVRMFNERCATYLLFFFLHLCLFQLGLFRIEFFVLHDVPTKKYDKKERDKNIAIAIWNSSLSCHLQCLTPPHIVN